MQDAQIGLQEVELTIQHGCWNRAREDREVYWIPDSPFIEIAAPKLSIVKNIAVVLAEGYIVVTVYARDDRFRKGEVK